MNAFATQPIVDTESGLLYQVDPESGEVISVEPVSPEFKVDSSQRADWVLGKMLALDAELAEVDACAIVQQARAILENAEKVKEGIRRKRAAIEWRFGPDLAEFVRKEIAGGKSKTWKGLYGSVSFRSSAAKLKVSDPEKAAWWAIKTAPKTARVQFDLGEVVDSDIEKLVRLASTYCDTVKPSFLISALPDDLKDAVMSESADVRSAWGFDVEPASEKATFKTGVS